LDKLVSVDECNQSIKLYKENSSKASCTMEIKHELTKSKVKIVKINIPILSGDSANISFGLWFNMTADPTHNPPHSMARGSHAHDRMVVCFTTTCAISAYHH